ncbi:MAG: branched-chain amino acid ABC transporter permease [Methylobacteriaceae bacterium]|nr:branched-chain amino acid ABC transporter permease [Methylobacteriaceae bacterium]
MSAAAPAAAAQAAIAAPDAARDFRIAFAIMTALLIAAPFVVYPVFLMQALCFALFACAFNLLIGYVGLLSFGHAMFMGFAGYIAAHLAKVGSIDFTLPLIGVGPHWRFGPLPPLVAIAAGVVCSALLGLLVGALAIRRQGIYFAMITLALAQMVYFFCLQAPFTHGEDGIQSVPRGKLLGIDLSVDLSMYFFVLAIFLTGFLLIYRIIHSPFGEVLKAIRENEARAVSLGYSVDRYKLAAFVLSAALSGLAGATKSLAMQNASLTDVHWSMSGEVVLMTLIGGLGTIFGPVVGAFVIIAMLQYLSPFGQWVTIMQGVIFVVCVLAFRRGVIGELAAVWRKSL